MENWKDCPDYEDCYEVSDHGNVRRKIGGMGAKQGKVLQQKMYKTSRYYHICLSKNNKPKTYTVHRLVAKAFLLNPDNLPEVDHIDRNKLNNHISNLRWVSKSKNQANRNMMKTNTSGEMYIQIYYKVSFTRDGKHYQKSCNSMEEAKQWRDQVLSEV